MVNQIGCEAQFCGNARHKDAIALEKLLSTPSWAKASSDQRQKHSYIHQVTNYSSSSGGGIAPIYLADEFAFAPFLGRDLSANKRPCHDPRGETLHN